MDQQLTDTHATSCRLWRQALSGDSEGVLIALEKVGSEPIPVLEADLLARLYVRAGRLVEARMLWKHILDADRNYAPAVRALAKLDSPWLVWAVMKKYSSWFGVGGLLFFAFYGIRALFFYDGDASFALMGVATTLAVLGAYLVGLFAWFFLTVESMFGFGGGSSRPGIRLGIGLEVHSDRMLADALRYPR